MTTIGTTLESIHIGAPASSNGLTMFPLLSGSATAPDYLLLDEALEAKLAEITEISQGGSVPELFFDNHSDRDILLMDGEELVGAKQNRVLNLTIQVGAGAKLNIPVSCVEAGRWAWRSRQFTSGKRKLNASARSTKMRGVSRTLARDGERASGEIQADVWRSVEDKMQSFQCASLTNSLHDVYDSAEQFLEPMRRAFTAQPEQVGTVFAIGTQIAGIDLFFAPSTLAKMLPKLVDSYAFDAIERQLKGEAELAPMPSLAEVAEFLRQIGRAEAREFPAVGKGVDLRIELAQLRAAALVVEGRVVHLSAFPG